MPAPAPAAMPAQKLPDSAPPPGAAAAGCFHCGLPLPAQAPWQVEIGGALRTMCCPGCEAVARGIVGGGFGDYYSTRTAFSATAGEAASIPPQLLLYDAEERASAGGAGGATADDADEVDEAEAVFSVESIRCAACVWLIERRLAGLPGVRRADLNVASARLKVRWSRAQCKPSHILGALRAIGYVAYPFDAAKHGEQLERARKTLFRQLFIAGLSMMQVMMYALPGYLATDGTMDADMTALMRWAALLLTLPAVVYSARPFLRGAWLDLKNRMPGMDVPVALGIAAAFGASVLATVRGDGEVYFDSVTMFIFLLLGSRYLELVARRKAAGALDQLQHALPASAWRYAAWPALHEPELVAAGQLREGDVILVKPGEAVAADGVILDGATEVDLSLLTGESAAQQKGVGAELPGGAVNATGAVVLRVIRPAQESTLSMLVGLIERAGQGKPQLALWADTVAAWFVAALLLSTVAVFLVWQQVDPPRAWQVAIAMLVVSCPCALSLATPTALAAATDRLLRQGVLIVRPHVLETLQRATHIIFDKTGTLTAGKPVLRHVEQLAAAPPAWCLAVAASLEASSAHPLAGAIVAAAGEEGASATAMAATDLRQVVGQGVEGTVDGVRYRLGSAAFVQGITMRAPALARPAEVTSVYLGSGAGCLARLDLADGLRDDARAVIKHFQDKGQTVILLSGDDGTITRRVATQLGIDEALGECLPQQKLTFVQDLQRGGAIVAMVGDGINDAAVLRAADVSFAMGGGSALAQVHADCVLLSSRLRSLCGADTAASQTIAVIGQNLAWATLYNLCAIPAAAFGLINPWLSGIGMSLSSAVVVVNALRLRRAPPLEKGA
jgi:P-type Cu2+ transporter